MVKIEYGAIVYIMPRVSLAGELNIDDEIKERFLTHVGRRDAWGVDDSVCCLWSNGSLRRVSFRIRRVTYCARRLSYYMYYGPIADGLFVRKTCDSVRCVNPAHLKLCPQKEVTERCSRTKRLVMSSKGKARAVRTRRRAGPVGERAVSYGEEMAVESDDEAAASILASKC